MIEDIAGSLIAFGGVLMAVPDADHVPSSVFRKSADLVVERSMSRRGAEIHAVVEDHFEGTYERLWQTLWPVCLLVLRGPIR